MYNIPNIKIFIGDENDLSQNINNPDFKCVNLANNVHTKILGYKPSKGDKNYVIFLMINYSQ